MSAVAERTKILLVDDSMLMRKAASKMLGEEFEVVTATDGDEGWERIQNDTGIQVVFTDLSMPRMDGYALLKEIRASEDEGTLNLPVIVVTGADNDESARKKALDLGATDFITKPFSSVDLLARARAHANYRRIARRLEQQSTLDALTGLSNKAGFLDRLQQDLAFAHRHAQPLSLVRIEIDDFRNLFLKQGKPGAEAVIRHVAQHLRDTVRQEDTAARIGLSGFALALPGGQHDGSKGLLERLRAQFASADVPHEARLLKFTVSAAVYTPELSPSLAAQHALEACDALVQSAMQAGGNRVVGRSVRPDQNDAPTHLEMHVAQRAGQLEDAPVAEAVSAAAATGQDAAAGAAPADASDENVLIDPVLQQIERGESLLVIPRLPLLLKRLLPLLRLLNARQRAQLVAYLQKLNA